MSCGLCKAQHPMGCCGAWADLFALLCTVWPRGVEVRVEEPDDENNGGMFGVWACPAGRDRNDHEQLIGADTTLPRAMEDAIREARIWALDAASFVPV